MAAKKHPKVIDGRRRLIALDVLESDEAAEEDYIDCDGAASNEEDGSGFVGAGITEELEDMQKDLKYSSISSYILKSSHLFTYGFKNNRMAHEKLFKHMCSLGSREKWRERRRVFSSYIDVETTKYQCRILNHTPLD